MYSTVNINFNQSTQRIQAENRNGSYITTINNIAIPFGDVQVPLRDILELGGKQVNWDEPTGTVIIGEPLPMGITKSEFDYLARIVQAEAGGEDIIGKIMVANVIINRLNSSCNDFRNVNTIKEVILQTNRNSQGQVTYQFSPVRDGSFARAIPSQSTNEAVRRALNGEDHSQGATFFRRARDKHGTWHYNNLRHLFTHGGHAFFKP